jgi:hypothetical protein
MLTVGDDVEIIATSGDKTSWITTDSESFLLESAREAGAGLFDLLLDLLFKLDDDSVE